MPDIIWREYYPKRGLGSLIHERSRYLNLTLRTYDVNRILRKIIRYNPEDVISLKSIDHYILSEKDPIIDFIIEQIFSVYDWYKSLCEYSKNKVEDIINKYKTGLIQDLSEYLNMSRAEAIELISNLQINDKCHFTIWLLKR